LDNLPDETNPVRALRRDKSATSARMTVALEDAAHAVTNRVDGQGHFMDLTGGGHYNWALHAEATIFLAEAGSHFESHVFRSAARRAAWVAEKEAEQHCGLEVCMGTDNLVDTSLSARMLLAFADLGRERIGANLREPTKRLAAFVRAQQRSD